MGRFSCHHLEYGWRLQHKQKPQQHSQPRKQSIQKGQETPHVTAPRKKEKKRKAQGPKKAEVMTGFLDLCAFLWAEPAFQHEAGPRCATVTLGARIKVAFLTMIYGFVVGEESTPFVIQFWFFWMVFYNTRLCTEIKFEVTDNQRFLLFYLLWHQTFLTRNFIKTSMFKPLLIQPKLLKFESKKVF